MYSKLSNRVIRLSEVCQMTGASRATVWRWVKVRSDFPRPFKLSDAITVWDEAEVRNWIGAQRSAVHG